ncbi:hypothetical protein [Kibdelosporangium phytohabitans]|uniref:Hemerythrin-like domain-containing protein n=1 Tax=Kibdelosporangium phytohabitans TaxID=860235 RepID=A0A0N9I7R4_9PSEU|nr:hypothetical protein [Kibdelosporangium phytohabitans]ALG10550.1 hypothetical protein AOZ06_29910 [Kibdelosporangium phytohabitans]MBE1461649.1 hypothetical protein [Kibdelosporangium phytohabitans]
MPTSDHDLTAILADDHRDLARFCTELELDQGSPENRKELADHLIAQFVQHLVAEDLPRPGDDHDEVDDVMRRLADTGPQQPQFETLLGAFIQTVRSHVDESGPAALQQIQSSCSPDRLRHLGKAVRQSRDRARSVPHPAVSDRVAPKSVLRRGSGIVDRARSAASQSLPQDEQHH